MCDGGAGSGHTDGEGHLSLTTCGNHNIIGTGGHDLHGIGDRIDLDADGVRQLIAYCHRHLGRFAEYRHRFGWGDIHAAQHRIGEHPVGFGYLALILGIAGAGERMQSDVVMRVQQRAHPLCGIIGVAGG